MVDFNRDLAALLKEMRQNQRSERWLFVSEQRGSEGDRARSFRETLLKARERVGLGVARRKQLDMPWGSTIAVIFS